MQDHTDYCGVTTEHAVGAGLGSHHLFSVVR